MIVFIGNIISTKAVAAAAAAALSGDGLKGDLARTLAGGCLVLSHVWEG